MKLFLIVICFVMAGTQVFADGEAGGPINIGAFSGKVTYTKGSDPAIEVLSQGAANGPVTLVGDKTISFEFAAIPFQPMGRYQNYIVYVEFGSNKAANAFLKAYQDSKVSEVDFYKVKTDDRGIFSKVLFPKIFWTPSAKIKFFALPADMILKTPTQAYSVSPRGLLKAQNEEKIIGSIYFWNSCRERLLSLVD